MLSHNWQYHLKGGEKAMSNKYEEPIIEIIEFDAEDVITTSHIRK